MECYRNTCSIKLTGYKNCMFLTGLSITEAAPKWSSLQNSELKFPIIGMIKEKSQFWNLLFEFKLM